MHCMLVYTVLCKWHMSSPDNYCALSVGVKLSGNSGSWRDFNWQSGWEGGKGRWGGTGWVLQGDKQCCAPLASDRELLSAGPLCAEGSLGGILLPELLPVVKCIVINSNYSSCITKAADRMLNLCVKIIQNFRCMDIGQCVKYSEIVFFPYQTKEIKTRYKVRQLGPYSLTFLFLELSYS